MIALIIILMAFALGLIYMTFPGAISIEKLKGTWERMQRIFKREVQETDN